MSGGIHEFDGGIDMREAIKATLREWVDRIENQDEGHSTEWLSEDHFLGVAKFLKEVSFSLDDVELIGISAKLEMYLEKREKSKEREEEQWYLEQEKRSTHIDNLVSFCKKIFFGEKLFSVDLKKYYLTISESVDSLDEGTVLRLNKYFNEEKVLYDIYNKVKNSLIMSFWEIGKLPDFKDVNPLVEVEVKNFYRRADRYLSSAIGDCAGC